MKILANLDHPAWKITVFEMNARLSVKIENGITEQWYKFRDGSAVSTVSEVQVWLDVSRKRKIQEIFGLMAENLRLDRSKPDDSADLPFIV